MVLATPFLHVFAQVTWISVVFMPMYLLSCYLHLEDVQLGEMHLEAYTLQISTVSNGYIPQGIVVAHIAKHIVKPFCVTK